MMQNALQTDHAPFRRIDRVISGEGVVDSAIADYIQRLQAALGDSLPLSLRIAQSLSQLAGRQVFLFTGFVVPGLLPRGENDGPLGAIALARSLDLAGLIATIWVDPPILDDAMWLGAEIGLTTPIRAIDLGELGRCAHSPAAAIAIEKPGRNAQHMMHTFDGLAITSGSVPVDDLFLNWNEAGTLTIGIGDRGNEVGFGALHDEVMRLRPSTACCQCGCGAGVVSTTSTRLFLPAAVSNWGAYGIAAAMAILADSESFVLTPEEETRLLQVAAVRGCADGVRRRCGFGVDGLAGETSVGVVKEMQRIAQCNIPESEV
jgi:hypothetical protein